MTQTQLSQWIHLLIQNNNIHAFYKSTAWLKVREEVLREQNNECQICKDKGYYARADVVHHINYVRRVPRLALSKYDELGNINLLAVCSGCHNEIHKAKNTQLNDERW